MSEVQHEDPIHRHIRNLTTLGVAPLEADQFQERVDHAHSHLLGGERHGVALILTQHGLYAVGAPSEGGLEYIDLRRAVVHFEALWRREHQRVDGRRTRVPYAVPCVDPEPEDVYVRTSSGDSLQVAVSS